MAWSALLYSPGQVPPLAPARAPAPQVRTWDREWGLDPPAEALMLGWGRGGAEGEWAEASGLGLRVVTFTCPRFKVGGNPVIHLKSLV